jgi:hypothetical protein
MSRGGCGSHRFVLTGVRQRDPTYGPVLAWNFVKDDADSVRPYAHDLGVRGCQARQQFALLSVGDGDAL